MEPLDIRRFPYVKIIAAVSTIWITILLLIASERNETEREKIPLDLHAVIGTTSAPTTNAHQAKIAYLKRLFATIEPNAARAAMKGAGDEVDFIDPGIIDDWVRPTKTKKPLTRPPEEEDWGFDEKKEDVNPSESAGGLRINKYKVRSCKL